VVFVKPSNQPSRGAATFFGSIIDWIDSVPAVPSGIVVGNLRSGWSRVGQPS
jgi:hypothetical protein